jgi:ribose transport system ATP-binding protein
VEAELILEVTNGLAPGLAFQSPEAPQAPPVLALHSLSKSFGGAQALCEVSFSVTPGEVHGLLGKNGSGKSTLVKILAGFHAPDPGGHLEFNGESVDLPLRPGDFRRLGMSFVHQNLGLVPSLTVLENLRLVQLTAATSGFINWRAERAGAREALTRFGLDLDPGERVDRISPVERALLAIVRAFEEIEAARRLTGKPGLVLLDEPTPFLPAAGVAKLFTLIRSIAQLGSGVIFISHDIDEVMQITDRMTVLRDGVVAGELKTAKATHSQIVEMIVGRDLAKRPPVSRAKSIERPVLARIDNVSGKRLKPTSIVIARGEILGLTGLIGSGYEEVPYLVYGARPCQSGSIAVGSDLVVSLPEMNPRRAMGLGFALLPGDRQGASGIDSLPIVDNVFLPDVARFFRAGRIRNGAMVKEARALGAAFEVRPNDPHLRLSALSGGNAQKVLVARWMNRNPRLLLLDEPTQGVDVGTRQQIFSALRAAADKGASVICASSDADQLAEICDRVLIFAKGGICAELTGADLTKDRITEACYASVSLGQDAPTPFPAPAAS